jgi:predicted glycosyltransferase involved in capsule biosynthesis
MNQVTYIIHTRIDCQERLNNLDFCINFLQSNFNPPIVIVEEDYTKKVEGRYNNVKYIFMLQESPLFNRTKLVNRGAKEYGTTKYLCLLDMDVFLDPETYYDAVDCLEDNSLVYPFNGTFYDIPQRYNQNKNLKISDIVFNDMTHLNTESVGGLQFVRTEDFFKYGMTNEFILGWGYEDNEFFARFTNLGLPIKRLDNPIYHFNHPRTFNSDGRSPHIHENEKIYNMVKGMNQQQVLDYIKTFPWL